MKTIGLCMIVKDEVQDVNRIIDSYGKYFDKIYITFTSDPFEVPKGVITSEFKWCDDFSKARNFNFAQAKTDFIFWMDADDDIRNPQAIRGLVEENPDVDLIYMNYLYAFDESGNCIMEHQRERLVKNHDYLVWKGRVHETLCPADEVILTKGNTDNIVVIHRAQEKDNVESLERNIKILTDEYNENGAKTDPRTLSYLATALGARGDHLQAIKLHEEHTQRSGWKEDIFISWLAIAQNFRSLFLDTNVKEYLTSATSADLEAMIIFPNLPDSYLGLGESYFHLKEWDKCIEWIQTGLTKKPSNTLPFNDPTKYSIRPIPFLAWSFLHKGQVDKAYVLINKVKQLAPQNPFIRDNMEIFQEAYESTAIFKKFVELTRYLEDHDKLKCKEIVGIIPDNLAADDRFIQLRNKYIQPKKWEEGSIAIFCGDTGEEWAPPSTLKGLGGSEEAVVYLSQELAKLGHKVVVYNNCGELEGEYNGVQYLNFYKFNRHDLFDTVISWRRNIFKIDIYANKKLVWLHDVPFKNEWKEDEYSRVDKIIVLSNYHRTLLSHVPDEKIYVSTNGLNIKDFLKCDKKNIKRNAKSVIYASSYDRGLEHLLDMWPEVKKAVPEAELNIFYGWDMFDVMHSGNMDQMKWKASMVEKMNHVGITEHGRVGHKRLLEQFAKSQVWAYPTFFQEINCITGLKAQAAGCVPVYNNHYALSDTVHFGVGVNPEAYVSKELALEEFKKKLIATLKSHTVPVDTMKKEIRTGYSWEKVAKDWSEAIL